jgi:hypothetical protein
MSGLEGAGMSYMGGGPYYAETCPACGGILWNGRCEDPDCPYHWDPKEDEDPDAGESIE